MPSGFSAGLALAAMLCSASLVAATTARAANCSKLSASETHQTVESFLKRPEGVLEQYPDAGIKLTSHTALVLTASPGSALTPVLDNLKIATADQRRSIGRGLGQAANACVFSGQPTIARQMLEQLRQREQPDALASFNAVFMPTAAAGLPPSRQPEESSKRLLGSQRLAAPETNVFRDNLIVNPLRPIQPIK
ncbi:hypothetical protein ASF58_00690 [Methylobacterium sp. Leaf125]|jgi:hypothetical protein|uniref:hypothetical protein n=1 Tax=Methylobacterium sp. Leaf125 TaxID=1736265 RepID=UPI0006F62E22|nr:hypothetical protein [Methylobacterium sp. Leaf125]KQQ47917.1 hypothetical protein ASF58_00690 [Methylobacterium sp. Leaf125]